MTDPRPVRSASVPDLAGAAGHPGGLSRRTVLAAAAWSTPVVALMVGAPAASASDAGFDLALAQLNFGDGLTAFSADFSRRWVVPAPIGKIVVNRGTVASPAGATLTASADARAFRFTGISGAFGSDTPQPLTIVSNTTSGNRSTITGVIPTAIPAGADEETGFRIFLDFDTIPEYPNDALPAVLDRTWVIGSPQGDADTTNNTSGDPGYVDQGPATPWGVLVDATWERVEFAGGAGYSHRATSATLTSVGPNPAVSGAEIQIITDQRVSTAISVTDIRLNGAPAGGAIVFDRDDSFQGEQLYRYYKTTVDLVEGDVVTFSLSYTDGDPATVPVNLSGSQVNFTGVVPNDENRRARNSRTGINNDRTGFEETP